MQKASTIPEGAFCTHTQAAHTTRLGRLVPQYDPPHNRKAAVIGMKWDGHRDGGAAMSPRNERRLTAAVVILVVTAILVAAEWVDFVKGIRRATGGAPYDEPDRPGLITGRWGGSN